LSERLRASIVGRAISVGVDWCQRHICAERFELLSAAVVGCRLCVLRFRVVGALCLFALGLFACVAFA